MASEHPLERCLISPNEADSNDEPANVVDGLFAIARAIHRLADKIEEKDIDMPLVATAIERASKWR